MNTSPNIPTPATSSELDHAVSLVRRGGVVVIPTDTLYGLAADIRNEGALQKIFSIKGRPKELAIPVLVSGKDQLAAVTGQVSEMAHLLADRFWPGPLTLVVPRATHVSPLLTGGRDTVAVRMPNHPIPVELARRLGGPITGTSANISGQEDLLTLEEVLEQLDGSVDYIIRSGPVPRGTASTVVEVCNRTPILLREGVLPFSEVLEACGLRD
ncbi:MAG: L-threonylcarbamoyladenylate synthase [Dehalococcoidia bacterium]